jgi:Fic family protein
MPRTLQAYKTITTLREQYGMHKIVQESLLSVLAEVEVPEQVYNSNAIENSTITLEETEKILLQIDLDRYISEREFFEAKNLARVMTYISHAAHEKPLTLEMITLLHIV